MSRVAAILLAAGGASRMGRPKQLLELDGESLVRRAARAALASRCDSVFVVVGAAATAVGEELAGLEIELAEAAQWSEGLGASIRAGIEAVCTSSRGPFDAVLLLLADQPRVTEVHLDRIVRAFKELGRPLVASRYQDTLGVPALFGSEHFAALGQLQGDQGAKALILSRKLEVLGIPLPEAEFDIDEPGDLGSD